jgi:hypothetical protein
MFANFNNIVKKTFYLEQ